MDECPVCHHSLASEADFCPHCRALMGAEQPASAEPEPSALDEQILSLLRAGRKIEAIKLCRAERQVDLRTAKESVEAMAAKHGIAPQKAGCAAALALILAAAAGMLSAAVPW